MPTQIEPELLTFNNWTFRFRSTQSEKIRLLIMIHGWMGDENSMWVLARKLSPGISVLAPRGPYPVAEGGYSWRKIRPGSWGMAPLEDLIPAANALLAFVEDWSTSIGLRVSQFDLMGFSQGAAMVYTLALMHPERVKRLVALSGFFPANANSLFPIERLSGKPIFVSHGRQDPLLSVDQARNTVAMIRNVGAKVKYCESDDGHKVSMECMRDMAEFLNVF